MLPAASRGRTPSINRVEYVFTLYSSWYVQYSYKKVYPAVLHVQLHGNKNVLRHRENVE